MSSIATLIDPAVAQQMTALVADVTADEPAKPKARKPKAKVKHGSQPIVTEYLPSGTKVDRVLPARHHERCKCERCGRGTSVPMTPEQYEAKYGIKSAAAPRRLSVSDAIDIDPKSGAHIESNCVDCGVRIKIDPQAFDPEFFEDEDSLFFPLCNIHAEIRQAMKTQRQVEATKRTTQKEQDMDLDNLSDAEIGATVRQQMKAEKAEKVKAAKPVVEKQRKKEAKAAKKGTKAKQAERKQLLPGFMVGTTHEVPALDLSEVPSLDEAPSAKERSPYNKARFRLTNESPLDPEDTTYRTLMAEHERLRALEAERVATKAAEKPKKKKAKETVVLVAEVNEVDKAKVKRLAKALGITKREARDLVASL